MSHGRGCSAGADAPGAASEVVISDHYWRHDLQGDLSVVGTTMMLDGRPATVMGILAPDIEIGNISEIDVWTPLSLAADAPREERILRVNGRLKPGVTVAQATAEVQQVSRRLAQEHPTTSQGWTARVAPTREAMTGTDTFVIRRCLTVVGFGSCWPRELANLVLSRVMSRRASSRSVRRSAPAGSA